ncbi:MAG: hypothetical protein AAFO94_13625, partial [Bacteroidota bacterium]
MPYLLRAMGAFAKFHNKHIMQKFIIFIVVSFYLTQVATLRAQVLTNAEYRPFQLPAMDYVSSYDFADFNRDGRQDVAVATLEADGVHVYIKLNEGDSTQFSLGRIDTLRDFDLHLPSIVVPVFMTLSDIDSDGDSDLYLGELAGHGIEAEVHVVQNLSGSETLIFEPLDMEHLQTEFVAACPSTLDFNQDGREDLVVSDFNGQLRFYRNDGNFDLVDAGQNKFSTGVFKSLVSLDEIQDGTQKKLISYTYEDDFQTFLDETASKRRYTLIRDQRSLSNPDSISSKFFQLRAKDINGDNSTDVFLSAISFSSTRGYYTENWMYRGLAFSVQAEVSSPACPEMANGSIRLKVGRGVSPYTYKWKRAEAAVAGRTHLPVDTFTINNLSSGHYLISVTDAAQDSFVLSVTIEDPLPLFLSYDVETSACHGDCNNSVEAISTGGTGIHHYEWSTGDTEARIGDLCEGEFALTLTDEKGCSLKDTMRVKEPVALSIAIDSKNPACNQIDGYIKVIGEGGTAPYQYSWDNGSADTLLHDLTAGNYGLTVTDANQCESTELIELTAPLAAVIDAELQDVSCHGGDDGAIALNVSS